MPKLFGYIKDLRSTSLRVHRKEKDTIDIAWDGEKILIYRDGSLYKTLLFEEDQVSSGVTDNMRYWTESKTAGRGKISFQTSQGGTLGTTNYSLVVKVVDASGAQVFYEQDTKEEDGFYINPSSNAIVDYIAIKL